MRIYLAGPLFTTAERDFNARLAEMLRARGHKVWLPQELEQHQLNTKAIFQKDVEGIDWCEVVVACMDGPDPDSGTCWECGYAYGKKRILLFRTDAGSGGEAEGEDRTRGLANRHLFLQDGLGDPGRIGRPPRPRNGT